MQTIIEYLKSTYNASQLAFLAVLGILVALGFLVSFTFACIKTCKAVIRKKISLETEISETYLLYTHLCDQLKELPDGEEKDTEKTKKLELEIAELKQTLKTLLGGKDLSAAKKIADFNLKRQKLKIAKTEERRDVSGVAKLVYIPPEANFLDADAAEEVKTIFADADIPFNDESLEYTEKIPPEISARWKITIRNGIYTAELFIGDNSV